MTLTSGGYRGQGASPVAPNIPAFPLATDVNGCNVFKFGIVGGGCIGREHISNISILHHATVAAVADTFEGSREACKKLLKALHMPDALVIEDYMDLFKMKDIDAVIVATPNNHHVQVIRDAYACGVKALLVEKPLCTTLKDCFEVLKLVEAHPHVVFWVGMEYRYIPSIDRLITHVHSGEIGDIKMLSIREHRFPFLAKVGNWNRFTENTGGTLVEKCCHFFDLMLHIVGSKPTRIMASGAQDVNHKDEVYDGKRSDILDNALVIVEFEGGQRACLDLCMFAEASRNQEEIACVGDSGKIEAFAPAHGAEEDDESMPNFIIGRVDERRNSTESPPRPIKPELHHISIDPELMNAGHHCGATYYELEVFREVVTNSEAAQVDAVDGLLAVALGIAAHQAINERRIVHFSELGVDQYWEKRHAEGGTSPRISSKKIMQKPLSKRGLSGSSSGRNIAELQQPLPQDGQKHTQCDGWELSQTAVRVSPRGKKPSEEKVI